MDDKTKKMNEEWTRKQQEMKKTWSGYYIGGGIIALAMFIFVLWMLFFK